MRGWSIGFCLIILSCVLTVCHAESCDPSLTPSDFGGYPYAPRGTRCEGFYRSQVAVQTLGVVAVLEGPLNYVLDSTEVVALRSTRVADRQVFVRAQAIPLLTYYRMDAALAPRQVLEWPVRDVLRPNNLHSQKIGVYAWYKDGNRVVLAPLQARSAVVPASRDSLIRVILRPSTDVSEIAYVCSSMGGTAPVRGALQNPFSAGAPVVVVLPAALHGRVTLQVQARVWASSEWLRNTSIIDLGTP